MRARLASIAITLNIVVGSLAPSVGGAVSDQSKTRPDALQLAMVGVALTALVASVVLLWPLESRYVPLTAAARAEEQDLASV